VVILPGMVVALPDGGGREAGVLRRHDGLSILRTQVTTW
jgi:hypothetical protein